MVIELASSRLLLELGRGGMSTVYLVSTPDGLRVLKELAPELQADERASLLFDKEAELATSMVHPNIVRAYGMREVEGRAGLEMEFLDGRALDALERTMLRAGERLSLRTSLWVVDRLLAALAYAHERPDGEGRPRGLVHRDVSPHNVLVTYEGEVKLLDFGISKGEATATSLTRTGEIKGKVVYMAPEQAVPRGPVDRRADLFAAGVVLWELVTGARYWGEKTELEVLGALAAGPEPRPARSVDPSLPASLDAVLLRVLSPDPQQRYPTADALRGALASIEAPAAGDPVEELRAALQTHFGAARDDLRAQIEARLASTASLVPRRLTSSSGPPAGVVEGEPSLSATPVSAKPRSRRVAVLAVLASLAVGVAALSFARARDGARRAALGVQPAAAPGCSDSNACGAREVCRSSRCVSLETPECRLVAAPAAVHDPRTLWLATMFPTSLYPDDKASEDAVRLALRDFDEIAGGIPSVGSNDPPRPIGLLACDASNELDGIARHLADDLRVPAVIGFDQGTSLNAVASGVFLPAGTLVMVTADTSPDIARIPMPPGRPRLLWRTSAGTQIQTALARLVPQSIEPALRRARVLRAREPLRVAVILDESAAGRSVTDVYESTLVFNGKSALQNGDDFLELALPPNADLRDVAKQLATFAPHVVLSTLSSRLNPLLDALEDTWTVTRYRPLYFSFWTLWGDAPIHEHPDLRSRLFGAYFPLETPENLRFTLRFNEGRTDKLAYSTVPGPQYDATYVVAYAASLLGEGEIDGTRLVEGIARLGRGAPISVGPAGIRPALEELRAHGQIRLRGTSVDLTFDPATGDVDGDIVLDCERPVPRSTSYAAEEIDVVYDARSRRWRGDVRCP